MQFDPNVMKKLLGENDATLWQTVRAYAAEKGIRLPEGQRDQLVRFEFNLCCLLPLAALLIIRLKRAKNKKSFRTNEN